ncbi:MAG: TonB family protein [Rudaea sp.]
MMLPPQWFAIIDAIGAALLHFLWQGAALGLLYFLLRPLCVHVTARYRLGIAVLLALAVCPVVTLAALWPAAGAAAGVHADSAVVVAVAGQASAHWQLRPLLPWLVAFWLGGVFVIAARSLWQWRGLQGLLHTAQRPDAAWENRLARLRDRFGIRRPVRLLVSVRVLTPMLIGWLKPAILLPAGLLSGFTPQQVELIIAHELGHIRRWDYLVNLAQVVLETVLFYHPVVHWICREVRNAREECCDDLVLSLATGNALAYARTLADLEEMRLDPFAAAPALGAGGGVLVTRIRRIVGVAALPQTSPRSYVLPMLLAAAALTSLVWRAQQRSAEVEAALGHLSAQALALVSGNARLIAPQSLSLALPAPEIAPLSASVIVSAAIVPADVGSLDVRVQRPAAVVFARNALANVRDLAPSRLVPLAQDFVPTATAPDDAVLPSRIVSPIYPQRAMSDGIEGRVALSYRIRADGSVGAVRIVHAQPTGVFEDAARIALNGWHFPASAAGQERIQNFAFTLHGKSAIDDRCQSPTGTMICRRPGD